MGWSGKASEEVRLELDLSSEGELALKLLATKKGLGWTITGPSLGI